MAAGFQIRWTLNPYGKVRVKSQVYSWSRFCLQEGWVIKYNSYAYDFI